MTIGETVHRATRAAQRGAQEAWLWVDEGTSTAALDRACQSGCTTFLTTVGGLEVLGGYQLPQRARVAVTIGSREQLAAVLEHPATAGRLSYVLAESVDALPGEAYQGAVGLLETVDDHDSLLRVVAHIGTVDLVAISFKDPTNIPLELVLAEAQSSRTRVAKVVDTTGDGVVSLMTMEGGADVVVLRGGDQEATIAGITALAATVDEAAVHDVDLRPATVTAVTHCPMGTRVCIDTTSALGQDEGMLLGSTSSGGLVTCSETHHLPYMDLRPFRVNAGALHLYVWGPDDRTHYLSDLRAGTEVLVVNSAGRARSVTVGRVKIERRPLLLIEAEIEGTAVNTFVQDDWHVRMMGAHGEIRPSSEIAVGDELLGYLDTPGRHVGIRIEETIAER